MNEELLFDITEICRMLGVTSRTLRFYESKGLIQSTKIGISARRKYTEKQMQNIKNVLLLRSLGLSVKSIRELLRENADLRETVFSKRAEIYASIDVKIHEINLLSEVLAALDAGEAELSDIVRGTPYVKGDESEIIRICTEAIMAGKTDILYGYMSERMKKYLPVSAYETIRSEIFQPLGDYISAEESTADPDFPHRFIQHIRFSKMGLKITFIILYSRIEGLWLGYYDAKKKGINI